MIKTILAPLDGSELSERALPTAIRLAQAVGGRIVLVRAAWAAGLNDDSLEAQLNAVGEAEGYLDAAARRVARHGVAVDAVVPYARPADAILLETDLRRADLVVMTTHGRSGLGRWVYGSVAEALIARSRVPVWLMRPDGPVEPAQPRARLLVPLDGSPFAEAVLPEAVEIARALDWTVVLMQALSAGGAASAASATDEPGQDGHDADEGAADAQRYLAGVAAGVKAEGLRAQTMVRLGAPAAAILDEERAAGMGLIAMATHGRTGLSRLLMGSVASSVLRRGGLPLLLARPSTVKAQERKVDVSHPARPEADR
ncbi:MAG: universal stress protein [Anaerolineae bacterium]